MQNLIMLTENYINVNVVCNNGHSPLFHFSPNLLANSSNKIVYIIPFLIITIPDG